MKHIKKYRGKFLDKENDRFMSRARARAKSTLSKKYWKEYKLLLKKAYKRIKKIEYDKKYLKSDELEGGA